MAEVTWDRCSSSTDKENVSPKKSSHLPDNSDEDSGFKSSGGISLGSDQSSSPPSCDATLEAVEEDDEEVKSIFMDLKMQKRAIRSYSSNNTDSKLRASMTLEEMKTKRVATAFCFKCKGFLDDDKLCWLFQVCLVCMKADVTCGDEETL